MSRCGSFSFFKKNNYLLYKLKKTTVFSPVIFWKIDTFAAFFS